MKRVVWRVGLSSRLRLVAIGLSLGSLWFGCAWAASTNVLIALGSSWKYLDDGSNQGTNWIARTFDDSSWSNGLAQLGFGDGDEVTTLRSARADQTRIVTYYFRRAFVLTNAADYVGLSLRLLRDDAGVVYLNGVEIFRSPNLPTGSISYDTLATATGENTIDEAVVDWAVPGLVNGTNVVAVEIHQASLTSSDLSFDFELIGLVSGAGGNLPPTVALSSPTNGATFIEPATLTLVAQASDPDGVVVKVEFFQNGQKLAQVTNAPYNFTWVGVLAGSYTLNAVATDDKGATATSTAVNVTVLPANQPSTNVLVALGSTWKYLDNGSDQGTNWSQLGFDDSGWASGPAPLGYPAGGSYGIVTVVSFGPDANNKYITTYFRRRFELEDPYRVLGLVLTLRCDDGAVVYLNGLEVFRTNMPAGPVTFTTLATTAIGTYDPATALLPSNALAVLVAGTNVLAVEVHQANRTSSDIVLDAKLGAILSAETNARPVVALTAPANGLLVAAPATLTLTATASDRDGWVSNVIFLVNGTKLAEDNTAPYSFTWTNVPAGVYALAAAAVDNVGWWATSAVVTVTVSTNTAPPVVWAKNPAPGTVTSLTNITVTFSKPVMGVDAADLLINSTPATALTGSGSNYTFHFQQPAYGLVTVRWASGHGITDLFTPPHPFNTNSPGANWDYMLVDVVPPVLAGVEPIPGTTVPTLKLVRVTFSEPVNGVEAADLLINGVPASSLVGSGAGPYTFSFTQPNPGPVQVRWAAGHGIVDGAGNPFGGGAWMYLLDPNAMPIVINEIMYHPASENILEEFIELHNRGGTAVNLAGWRLRRAVRFDFPAVSIPPGGYLVVCADPATFAAKYPGVTNVVGPWSGFLNNSDEEIQLEDAQGNLVTSVRYADEGDWAVRQRGPNDLNHRGWTWYAAHDGGGKSLELMNPALPNDAGQNWAPSLPTNGTPGRPNSVLTNNVAPLILGVRHFPIIPKSTDPVQVTARIVDEALPSVTVTLHHRIDSTTPGPFTVVPMTDDGQNGDAVAGDGLYTGVIPPHPNDTVVEFYIQAIDLDGRVRTWPPPAIAAWDGAGPTGQVANALYQVDDRPYNPTNNQPLYKLIMTAAEAAELASIPCSSSQNSDALMNGTFISLDTSGVELRYLVGFRNRGHATRCANPPNYHVSFRHDERWKGVTDLTLNSQNAHVQHLGSVLARKCGVAGANSIAVQVRVNNVPRTPTYGSYVANEVVNADWAEQHYPLDPNGNIYKVVRDIPPPDLNYRGEEPAAYRNTYFKECNVSEDWWGDLIGMLRVFGINNPVPFTPENVRQVINVEQWIRHLAVMNLFGNAETGLNSGYNDDYFIYFGVNDPRAVLLYWDLDSILGVSSMSATVGIYTCTANNGSGQALSRFLNEPEFNALYLRTLKTLLETAFAQSNFNALVDQTLGSYVPVSGLNTIKNWMDQRRAYLLGSVLTNVPPASNPPVATVTGAPRSPTPLTAATLRVGGSDVVAYRYRLDQGPWSPELSVATPIVLIGLSNGVHTVEVLGLSGQGLWQEATNATTVSWEVNSAWPGVRLNEVLARNLTAVNHHGTFPDLIELFNEGTSAVDLGGMRLSDDRAQPAKFTFPAGTSLAPGAYLVVYANDPDGTPGLHLGFNLNGEGEGVYLFDRADRGGALLDSVRFGPQLADLSIGRLGNSGQWVLCQPTFGSANRAQPLGDPRRLKINEWLASGQNPYPYDFVELYNPDPLPVALEGLALTDQPIGAPRRSPLPALSFIAGRGWIAFIADGQPDQGPLHLDFRLNMDQGEIALVAADGTQIDWVGYGPQQTDVSSGLCPDGSLNVKTLTIPTPGGPNACPFVPPPPTTISLITISNVWRYQHRTNFDGVNWTAPAFDDSAWASGPALLGQYTPTRPQTLPEPIRTVVPTNYGQITFYFRTRFTVPPGTSFTSLEYRHIVDDGAVFYLNGIEVGRFNMPSGPITSSTLSASTVGDASYQGPFSLPTNLLLPGENVFAVEVHQGGANSSDIAFGLELNGLIVTNSPALAGVLINEVLANNATLEEPDGRRPDWVEIYNPSSTPVDLADMSLTDNTAEPRRWVFPPGSVVPGLGFLKVQCDGDLPASATNTGFGLKAEGGAVYLFHRPADGGTLASAVTYGLQAPDWSIGRVPDGSTNWVLTIPNLGGPNLPATLGNAALVKINEWMADPASGDDWFELFNPNAQPVDISRFWLSDDLANRQRSQLPALSFLGVGAWGFQLFKADGNTAAGADHVNFGLRAAGEALALSRPDGVLVDGLTFGPQRTGVSEGRLPDGTTNRVFFTQTPTPGKANFLPLDSVVINEVFSHSESPFEDAVEIYNPTGDDVDIGGWYLSDSQNNLLKYRIPANTVVPAGGYVVFYEYQFNFNNPDVPFAFSSVRGDQVYLSEALGSGQLTGYRAFAEFGPAESGVSFGRFRTSVGVDFTAMSARSFGVDNPATVEQFRTGTGKTNPYPKVGPVVINEIMYQPASTNPALEYIELHNLLGTAQPLYDPANPYNTWRLRKGVDYDFPPGVVIPPGGFIVVVSFDPRTDTEALAQFRAAYGERMALFGPWSGRLDNAGEAIELQKPGPPVTTPGPDYGLVPRIVVDRVVYSPQSPWPTTPAGTGHSLQKTVAALYGNEPLNWFGGAPTPGAPNGGGAPTNSPPVLTPIADQTVIEGLTLSFTATATDPDLPPQTLVFSLDPGAPEGADITADGRFSWTPSESQGPGVYPITVRVSDSGTPVLSATQTFIVTVLETNSPPGLVPIGNKIINEAEPLTIRASASDPDLPPQTLVFSLGPGAPPGATITAQGLFSWTPDETYGGSNVAVTIRVTDNGDPPMTTSETITITVLEVNSPPVWTPISNRVVNAGTPLSFMVTASDPDLPVQTLTYSLGGGAPAGATLEPASGRFSWTPPAQTPTSTNVVAFRVTDNGNPPLSATQPVTIVVVGAPRQLQIAARPEGQVTVQWDSYPGRTYRVEYTADLHAPVWTPLGQDRLATGYTTSITDTLLPGQQRFYRVRLL